MGELLCDIGRKLSQLIIIDHMPAPIFGLSTFTHFISYDNKEDGNKEMMNWIELNCS